MSWDIYSWEIIFYCWNSRRYRFAFSFSVVFLHISQHLACMLHSLWLGVVVISFFALKVGIVSLICIFFLLAMSFEGKVKSKNVQSLLPLIGSASCTEFCPQFHLNISIIWISLDVSEMMDFLLCSATE